MTRVCSAADRIPGMAFVLEFTGLPTHLRIRKHYITQLSLPGNDFLTKKSGWRFCSRIREIDVISAILSLENSGYIVLLWFPQNAAHPLQSLQIWTFPRFFQTRINKVQKNISHPQNSLNLLSIFSVNSNPPIIPKYLSIFWYSPFLYLSVHLFSNIFDFFLKMWSSSL